MIIPGIRVSVESLTRETAKLPKIGLEKPKKVIGSNTVECMKSGAIYGTVSGIEGSIERMERELGESLKSIVMTGENAKYIFPYCERELYLDTTLLLDGLRIIYERNEK